MTITLLRSWTMRSSNGAGQTTTAYRPPLATNMTTPGNLDLSRSTAYFSVLVSEKVFHLRERDVRKHIPLADRGLESLLMANRRHLGQAQHTYPYDPYPFSDLSTIPAWDATVSVAHIRLISHSNVAGESARPVLSERLQCWRLQFPERDTVACVPIPRRGSCKHHRTLYPRACHVSIPVGPTQPTCARERNNTRMWVFIAMQVSLPSVRSSVPLRDRLRWVSRIGH